MGNVVWKGSAVNMTKGLVSIWFRVPSSSASEIPPATFEQGYYVDVLEKTIPLVIFSSQLTGPIVDYENPGIGIYFQYVKPGDPTSGIESVVYHGSHLTPRTAKMCPSFIGVYIGKDGKASLVAHLQTSDFGQGVNTQSDSIAAYFHDTGFSSPDGLIVFTLPAAPPYDIDFANSSSKDRQLEFFPSVPSVDISFDRWHHVILSWDLRGSNASHANIDRSGAGPLSSYVDATSLLYCSFDDKNITQRDDDLPCGYWFDGMGDNEIFCDGVFQLAGNSYDPLAKDFWGLPTYSVNFAKGVVMDTVAVPSEAQYQRTEFRGGNEQFDPICRIEVAELQIFPGKVLDTSSKGNRRLFIAQHKISTGKYVYGPADPKVAEGTLGKPAVLLHRSSNWIKGKGTGTHAKKFKPTGKIKRYEPDPEFAASS